ncbi:rhodanese-like domain-containing protein [Flavobacterium sp.]|uniref:rhodanese-like domain-containing protein n=1 Tax=Flavobacterium sp. TaxID=239 RepID=UPI0026040250|nr:rhodanese-like domain-containing protein [Flavobacterium sp.]MDG2431976.1 rhodanese-like domain-containing protein [Flavobacterium sp.]
MKNLVKICFLFLFFAISSNTSSAQNTRPVSKKQTTQKVKASKKNETFYVDVRTPAEFAQGSVIGAVNIPLDQVERQIAKFKGKKKIVVFCRSGNRSSQAITILEKNGIKNITNGGNWEDVNGMLKK